MKIPEPLHTIANACLILVLAITFASADDWQVPQLMQLLAQNKSGKATFVETKYIGIIDRPLVSTGDLSFVAPDRLEKRTLSPKPESLILNGDILTIDRPGKRQMKVSLDEHPEASAFIESIRGTLAGDLSALLTFYTLQLTGSAEKWQLVLTPKQQPLNRIISRIRIEGAQADVRSIELDQRDGDHSVMVITQTNVSR